MHFSHFKPVCRKRYNGGAGRISPAGSAIFNFHLSRRNKRLSPPCAAPASHGRGSGHRSGRSRYTPRPSCPGLHSGSRQGIPGAGQIVIFIDKPHVQPGRAGMAVVAVHAHPRQPAARTCPAPNNPSLPGQPPESPARARTSSRPRTPGSTVSTPGLSNAYCMHWYSLSARPKGEAAALRSCPPAKAFITEMPTPSAWQRRYSACLSSTPRRWRIRRGGNRT